MTRFPTWLPTLACALSLAGCSSFIGAHMEIRDEKPTLPASETVSAALAADTSRPVALWWINTASQQVPRSLVLDGSRDPNPETPYRMAHSSFLLEWENGRILLVDLGMTPEAAISFGRPSEILGAGPTIPHGSTAEQLGSRNSDVAAVVLTHLHSDHVEGITELCPRKGGSIDVFASQSQLTKQNYTTDPGRELLAESKCAAMVPLQGDGPLLAIPGFPGVRVLPVAGHTPGSQIILAEVSGQDGVDRYAFTGDVVNARDGILHDVPKPWLYRALIVPENDEHLGDVRRLLDSLRAEQGMTLLVSHDASSLEKAAVPVWPARP